MQCLSVSPIPHASTLHIPLHPSSSLTLYVINICYGACSQRRDGLYEFVRTLLRHSFVLVSAVCCSILLAATQLFFFLFFLLKKERSHKDYVNITFLKTHLLTTRRNLCTRPYTLSTGVLYTGLHGGNVAKVMGTFLFHFLSFFSLLFPVFFFLSPFFFPCLHVVVCAACTRVCCAGTCMCPTRFR